MENIHSFSKRKVNVQNLEKIFILVSLNIAKNITILNNIAIQYY